MTMEEIRDKIIKFGQTHPHFIKTMMMVSMSDIKTCEKFGCEPQLFVELWTIHDFYKLAFYPNEIEFLKKLIAEYTIKDVTMTIHNELMKLDREIATTLK